jgi:protein-disulfide isomerase-like protein with CxxC motif
MHAYLGATVGVPVHYFTDPACPMSWGQEPTVRRLMVEFGGELDWRLVMGGLGRDYKGHEKGALVRWVEDAAEIEMPMDPLLWKDSPISSSYPACIAVIAAGEQGIEAQVGYLRVLREGLLCFRRKLDSLEPFVEEARRAGLDVERFRVDAASHAMVEAFGADLELTRAVPEGSPRDDRVPFPTLMIGERWFFGRAPYDELAAAAEGEGAARRVEPLGVDAAFARFERLAAPEIAAICDLPGPRAHAELWQHAADWKVRALKVGAGGWLFERA